MVVGRLRCCRKNRNPDIPIAKATGIPVRRNNVNTHTTNSILEILLRALEKVPGGKDSRVQD
jgi:hypothetical protein